MRLRLAVVAAACVVATAACSGGGDEAAPDDGTTGAETPALVQPGAPGEPNETVDPDDVPEDDTYNDADVMFAQMMIPHHAQALEMVTLAESRSSSRDVARIAGRIRDTQRGEVEQMARWLQSVGAEVPPEGLEVLAEIGGEAATTPGDAHEGHGNDEHGDDGHSGMHDMHDMPGMLSPAQLDELADTRGGAFDALFAERMITHHEGALTMADEVLGAGIDVRIRELAADISLAQQVEIEALEDIDVPDAR